MLPNAFHTQAAGVDPVGADLTTNVDTVVGHALHKLFEQAKVLLSLIEFVLVVWHVQHAPMNPDRARRHSQEVRRPSVIVKGRAGEANLMREQLVLRFRPVGGFGVVGHSAALLFL